MQSKGRPGPLAEAAPAQCDHYLLCNARWPLPHECAERQPSAWHALDDSEKHTLREHGMQYASQTCMQYVTEQRTAES